MIRGENTSCVRYDLVRGSNPLLLTVDALANHRISDFELASRLSYFLWSSMPDDELLDLAEAGHLHEAEVLRRQVDRRAEVWWRTGLQYPCCEAAPSVHPRALLAEVPSWCYWLDSFRFVSFRSLRNQSSSNQLSSSSSSRTLSCRLSKLAKLACYSEWCELVVSSFCRAPSDVSASRLSAVEGCEVVWDEKSQRLAPTRMLCRMGRRS